jgi:hypothetical protein
MSEPSARDLEMAREWLESWERNFSMLWRDQTLLPRLSNLVAQAREEGMQAAEQQCQSEITALHSMLSMAWALLPPEEGERIGLKDLMMKCERLDCELLPGLLEKAREEGRAEERKRAARLIIQFHAPSPTREEMLRRLREEGEEK